MIIKISPKVFILRSVLWYSVEEAFRKVAFKKTAFKKARRIDKEFCSVGGSRDWVC
jgi:hypothetical protein